MKRVDTSSAVAALPVYVVGPLPNRYYSEGAPGVADGTVPGQDAFNMTQEEICNAITDDGDTLDATADDQLAERLSPLKSLKSHATDTGVVDTTHRRALIASGGCRSSGADSANVASETCTATAAKSQNNASNACDATGAASINDASVGCDATGIASGNVASEACVASGAAHSANVASDTCDATGSESANVASDNCSVTGDQAAALASKSSDVDGDKCAVLASELSVIPNGATHSMIAASANAEIYTGGYATGIMGAVNSSVVAQGSVLLASAGAMLRSHSSLGIGYSAVDRSTPAGAPGDADLDLTFKIDGSIGRGYFDDVADFGAADLAEFFENVEIGQLPAGRLVARVGRKVKLAGAGDRVSGVVSAAPMVCGNAAPLAWKGRHARDEFGARILEEHRWIHWPETTQPSAARVAARAAVAAARATVHEASEAVQGARVTQADQERHLRTPSIRFHAAKGKRQKEAALAALAVADAAMRSEIAERLATAIEAYTRAEEQLDAAKAALKPVRRDVEVVRAGFHGLERNAPTPIPDAARRWTVQAPRVSDDYDPSREYVSRRDRLDEWTAVALTGQVRVAVDASVEVDDTLVAAPGGIGTKGKPKGKTIEVMEIVQAFDAAKGYAIALCLVS